MAVILNPVEVWWTALTRDLLDWWSHTPFPEDRHSEWRSPRNDGLGCGSSDPSDPVSIRCSQPDRVVQDAVRESQHALLLGDQLLTFKCEMPRIEPVDLERLAERLHPLRASLHLARWAA